MRMIDAHLSDENLLLAIDGELGGARLAAANSHLSICPDCRRRREALETALTGFLRAHDDAFDPHVPPPDGPRAALKARLRSLAEPTRPPLLGIMRDVAAGFAIRAATLRSAAALTALIVVVLLASTRWSWIDSNGELDGFVTPDVRLTPGAAVGRSDETVCARRPDVEPPVVSRSLAMSIFRTYGIADPAPDAYELDFLIAPELGGATDVSNLWPQSYAGVWNAHLKDALEDHLYQLVCTGQLDLPTAQRAIATDWTAAYRKYFLTDAPLAAHQQFRKDQPWR